MYTKYFTVITYVSIETLVVKQYSRKTGHSASDSCDMIYMTRPVAPLTNMV